MRISDWSSDVCSSDLEASAPPLARDTPPLTGAADCEVAVIGAGYTGLTAALTLVEGHGMGVTVLEAGTPGWGASGRNGGFCCLGGAKLGYDVIAERYGPDEMQIGRAARRQIGGQKV